MKSQPATSSSLALFALVLASCEQYPVDPESSLDRALATGELRVGIVLAEPWVKSGGPEEPDGVEAQLIKEFAQELGLKIKWQQEGAEDQLQALEQFELDVLIGGLTRTNPWSKRVAFTIPYYVNRWYVGAPHSDTAEFDPRGRTIHVRSGSGLIRKLEKKGALVQVTDEFSNTGGAVAAELWEIEKRGLHPTNLQLKKESHAMAVAPGENALLTRLDDFLLRRADKTRVETLLRKADGL